MRGITINVSLPTALLRQIDQTAKTEFRSRSELLREAARTYVAREERWKTLQRYAHKKAKSAGVKTEADVLEMIAAARRSSFHSA